MKRTIAAIAVVLVTGIAACGGRADSPQFNEPPILDHLSNVLSMSALDGETVQQLDATLQRVMTQEQDSMPQVLNTIRDATMNALAAFEGQDSLDASGEARMRSLVEIMNLTAAIGEAHGIELALTQVVRKNHKCDRIGNHGQCISDPNYNCSHIGGSCFHVRKP